MKRYDKHVVFNRVYSACTITIIIPTNDIQTAHNSSLTILRSQFFAHNSSLTILGILCEAMVIYEPTENNCFDTNRIKASKTAYIYIQ